ncbi:hypothetical protein EIP91_010866 [Steccherinum ochraceum]|uniref:SCP2 domain-containing protein n=1 Tax=Steccherinum ochraceum TaxID=92696 RepID=A0A4R0RC12_9APHY|nr:hypothetical protein EIP91_010866 [Steccherinum ochraceum]
MIDHVLHDLIPSLDVSTQVCRRTLSEAPPEGVGESDPENLRARVAALHSGVNQVYTIIHHLRHVSSLLLYQRNGLADILINKLPNEVLAMIFCHASRYNSAAMFAISWTCSRWRTLALRTAQMWSVVNLRAWKHDFSLWHHLPISSPFMELIMERSGSSTMALQHFPSGEVYREDEDDEDDKSSEDSETWLPFVEEGRNPLQYIPSLMHRLVELNIRMHYPNFRTTTWLEYCPAPVLQKFALDLTEGCEDEPGFPHIARRLFAGEAPQLRVLKLTGLRLPWCSDVFPSGLKYLSIDEGFNPADFKEVDVEEIAHPDHPRYALDKTLRSVLEHCRGLEELSLQRCSNLQCGSSAEPEGPVCFPNLHTLALKNSVLASVYILRLIRPGKIGRLHISCDVQTIWGDTTLPRLSHFSEVVSDYFTMVQSLTVTPTSVYGSYSVEGFTSPENSDICIDLYDRQLESEDYIRHPYRRKKVQHVNNVLVELVKHVPLPQVHNLRVMHTKTVRRRSVAASVVARLLEHVPPLAHFVLEGFRAETKKDGPDSQIGSLPSLWERILARRNEPQGQKDVLSCLQSIQIKNCYLDEQVFIRFLRDGREHTPNLRSVGVEHSTLDSEPDSTERIVRELVQDVSWMDASETLAALAQVFEGYSAEEKKAQIKKTNGIFELRLKNESGEEGIWTIDLKSTGSVYKGEAKSKPNVTILMSDETFQLLAAGKLDGQKAFMTGKLKTKGNMMFATKLDGVLKAAKAKAKL